MGVENEPLGIVSLQEAFKMAEEADVDLVEIAPTAHPPVCRLMDYGKFKYAEQKKAHEVKLKQKVVSVKEVKFRPGTDDGDYNIKLRNLSKFLNDGDKCKVTLRFRGREGSSGYRIPYARASEAGSGRGRTGRAVSKNGRPPDGYGSGAKEKEIGSFSSFFKRRIERSGVCRCKTSENRHSSVAKCCHL